MVKVGQILSRILLENFPENTLLIRQKAGSLNYGRQGHGSVFDGGQFSVIGGSQFGGGAVKNEVCSLEGSSITCVEQSIALESYTLYPELFLVTQDYVKGVNKC